LGIRRALVVLALLCSASPVFAQQDKPDPAEDAAVRRADTVIKEHRLLTEKQQRCLSFMYRDDSDAKTAKVGIYEVHDKDCGGDPEIIHRLFDLEIDMKTGAAKWDNTPDMEMRPVPKLAR